MQNEELVLAKQILEIGAVGFNPTKPYVYTSGMISPIYCDLRLIMSHPVAREAAVRAMMVRIGDVYRWGEIDVVSGTATAGVPFASWIADRMNLPMIYVRSSKKTHGKGNQIEGRIQDGDSVVIVEDIISSGKSSLGNVAAVREVGARVVGAIAVASYEMERAVEAFATAEVRLEYLVPMRQVVETAVETGVLDATAKDVVLDWLDDPTAWAERHGHS